MCRQETQTVRHSGPPFDPTPYSNDFQTKTQMFLMFLDRRAPSENEKDARHDTKLRRIMLTFRLVGIYCIARKQQNIATDVVVKTFGTRRGNIRFRHFQTEVRSTKETTVLSANGKELQKLAQLAKFDIGK